MCAPRAAEEVLEALIMQKLQPNHLIGMEV